MFYYDVAVSGRGQTPEGIFTYSHHKNLARGTIVEVVLREKMHKGFIVKKSSMPDFVTTDIRTVSSYCIPEESIKTYHELCKWYPFSERSLANLFMTPTLRDVEPLGLDEDSFNNLPELNGEQQRVTSAILRAKKSCLLFGETGSGKTRIYQEIIGEMIKNGKSVVLLAPEIGLASFLHSVVSQSAPAYLYHSELSNKTRQQIWRSVSTAQKPVVVIGPRSALGLPYKNLGCILMDEAHEAAYRQDNSPFVHARVFASILAQSHNAYVVYGTATPPISDYYAMLQKKLPIHRITVPAVSSEHSAKIIVSNYEDDRRTTGNLLKPSFDSIQSSLKRGEQSLVLINRRGTARHVSCSNCGNEERCQRCDHLLAYHHDRHILRCHFCDTEYKVPTSCRKCGLNEITMKSSGTKALVQELSHSFPQAKIVRFDTDNSVDEQMRHHVDSLRNGSVDIVVGTQMIAKGLDLPLLSTMVLFASGADGGYLSEERDFQLNYQAIGRATRGHRATTVVIQTSNPELPALKNAIDRDYESFYQKEIAERRSFMYPPFCYLMVIHVRAKTSTTAERTCTTLKEKIAALHREVTVIGPTPNQTEKIGPFYNWHLVLKSKKRSELVDIAKQLGSKPQYEFDPTTLP